MVTLCVTAGRLLLRVDVSLREVGAHAIRTLGHSVIAPLALLDLAPLNGALMVCRLVLLRTQAVSAASPSALLPDVSPTAAVVISDVWPDILVGLCVATAAL